MTIPADTRSDLLPSHLEALAYPNIRTVELGPAELADTPRRTLGRALFMVTVIRLFEKWLIDHADLVHGPLHSSIGQEAVAVGMALALRPGDTVTSTHRAHHDVLAKLMAYYAPNDFDPLTTPGVPEPIRTAVRRTLAEILGLAEGLACGRGGSMHLADFSAGILTSAIVGGGIPIASGQGLAARLRGTSDVALAAFGDGATSIGAFHEGVSLARAWNLPVIFLLENNLYSVATTVRETSGFEDLAIRAAGYDMPGLIVDGMDPIAVLAAVSLARSHALAGGPVLVEARTYRYYHQNGPLPGSAFRYRTEEEEREWAGRDPAVVFPRRLTESGLLTVVDVGRVNELASEMVEACVASVSTGTSDGIRIRKTLYPAIETIRDGVLGAGLRDIPEVIGNRQMGGQEIGYAAAISRVTARWLERDPEAFVLGEEVGHLGGGVYGTTKDSLAVAPGRVLSTPICENGFAGASLGAAIMGMHPIVDIMFPDFALEASDQLFNHVAKARYMYGGAREIPIVLRTRISRGRGFGPQHSCDPAGLFAQFPGWRITEPSTATEYVGLFNAAMLTRDPVLVIEDHRLLKQSELLPPAGLDYVIPLQSARLWRSGSDATVLAWSHALTRTLAIVDTLRGRGLSIEVIDPRWLDRASFDRETVLASVSRTGALVIVEDAMRSLSVGAQIVDYLLPDLFAPLRTAPIRVTGEDAYAPVSKPLETYALLRDEQIEGAIVAASPASRRRIE